jgi:hypothetical protein
VRLRRSSAARTGAFRLAAPRSAARGGTRFASVSRMARRRSHPFVPVHIAEQRIAQAARARRRGEDRKALFILREVCFREPSDARSWTLYAVQCWRMGRRDDACRALRQALWLRERAHDDGRARVVRALLAAAEAGQDDFPRAA